MDQSLFEKNCLQNQRVIVSLTSFPKRIRTVHLTIQSLLKQSMKPYKILLWLAEEQFPIKEDLPNELVDLIGDDFEILWCDDLKPHKKYFYTFQRYPDDCIITVDDDCIYHEELVEQLYNSYQKFPRAISTMRARIIEMDPHGCLKDYDDWILADHNWIGIPAMDLLPIGCGGVLYPPHLIHSEVFNKEYIIKNCLFTDDLWLKVMHTINLVPTVLVSSYFSIETIEGTQEDALWINNCSVINKKTMMQLINDYNTFRKDGILLTDILHGKCGLSISKELAIRKQKEKDEILKVLFEWKKVIIYGAGFWARKTYDVLKKIDDIEIVCFAVTNKDNNPKYLDAIPVYEICNIQDYALNSIVVVGVDEIHHKEITKILLKNNFNNHMLITAHKLKVLS